MSSKLYNLGMFLSFASNLNTTFLILQEFGYSREQSSNALIIHGTVKKALEALSNISGRPAKET